MDFTIAVLVCSRSKEKPQALFGCCTEVLGSARRGQSRAFRETGPKLPSHNLRKFSKPGLFLPFHSLSSQVFLL